ncbi:MAG TPA: ABC-2 transporter permease [Thermoanaerobaculia bacterium]|nr:ABC-2 transporter permease [Thermoanaerobaculia bacterium]
MNYAMVKRLILKDWYFQRWAILGYLAAGALAVFLVGQGGEGSFYAGSILLLTVLITVGIHLPMTTVINERKEQTLAFVMSLPISAKEYTTAKILANVLILLIPWTAITLGSLTVIAGRAALPGGLIPLGAVVLTEILVGSCLLLAVALVSESLGWTIGAMVFANLFFQGFLYYVSHIPSIAATMKSPTAVWSSAAVTLLLAEIGAIALLLGLTFFFQSRKTDFI